MLTSEDIQKLLEVLATKEDMDGVRREIAELRESVHALTTSIDGLAKAVDDLRTEYAAVVMKVDRHEKWLHQIADKLGLKLDYE